MVMQIFARTYVILPFVYTDEYVYACGVFLLSVL